MIFEQFEEFQRELLSKVYFNELRLDPNYPIHLELCFLYDRKSQKENFDVLNNFNYALKRFITLEEYNKIKEEENKIVEQRIETYPYFDRKITIENFNLISGPNDSGKTMILKTLSEKMDSPVFNLNVSADGNKLLCNTTQYFENLELIKNICQRENYPILLDDICWNSFDGRNRLKFIDSLYDYSHDRNVIFTSSSDNTVELLKKRTHNSNIIKTLKY